MIAPAVQEVFSVAGEDDRASIHRTQLDLFFLKQSADKKLYALLDPQYIFNHKTDEHFGILESDFGYVFDSGVSVYARPAILTMWKSLRLPRENRDISSAISLVFFQSNPSKPMRFANWAMIHQSGLATPGGS